MCDVEEEYVYEDSSEGDEEPEAEEDGLNFSSDEVYMAEKSASIRNAVLFLS